MDKLVIEEFKKLGRTYSEDPESIDDKGSKSYGQDYAVVSAHKFTDKNDNIIELKELKDKTWISTYISGKRGTGGAGMRDGREGKLPFTRDLPHNLIGDFEDKFGSIDSGYGYSFSKQVLFNSIRNIVKEELGKLTTFSEDSNEFTIKFYEKYNIFENQLKNFQYLISIIGWDRKKSVDPSTGKEELEKVWTNPRNNIKIEISYREKSKSYVITAKTGDGMTDDSIYVTSSDALVNIFLWLSGRSKVVQITNSTIKQAKDIPTMTRIYGE